MTMATRIRAAWRWTSRWSLLLAACLLAASCEAAVDDDDSSLDDDDSGDDDDSAVDACAPEETVDPACSELEAPAAGDGSLLEGAGCPYGDAVIPDAASWATWLDGCLDGVAGDPLVGFDWSAASVLVTSHGGDGYGGFDGFLWLADCPAGLHYGAWCFTCGDGAAEYDAVDLIEVPPGSALPARVDCVPEGIECGPVDGPATPCL